MFKTATVTKQGQISIPSSFRKKFSLNRNKKVQISLDDNKLIIEPLADLLDHTGALTAQQRVGKSMKEIEDLEKRAIEEGFSGKFTSHK